MPTRTTNNRRRRPKARLRKTVMRRKTALARQRKTTSRRRKTSPSRTVPSARIIARALKAFGTRERVKRWMQVPLAQFEGRTPAQLLQTEIGARQLEILLARMGHGIAA